MSKEAMKLALEALENAIHPWEKEGAITALREALAQPEQEPVAWMTKTGSVWKTKADKTDEPLYTSLPAQRKPLTDEEIADLWSAQIFHINDLKLAKDFVRDIEAAHGIKENT